MGVNVTIKSVIEETKKYHNFPDFPSIIKVLYTWNLSSSVYEMSTVELAKQHDPYITFWNGDFVLAENTIDGNILIHSASSCYQLPMGKFCENFCGFVILACKDKYPENHSAKPSSGLQLGSNYYWLITIIAVLIGFILSIYDRKGLLNWEFTFIMLSILKMIGLGVTIVLLKFSINKENRIAKKFCKEGTCDAILSSYEGHLPFGITWADLGFFYFAGTVFLLVTKPLSALVLKELAVFNIFCLLFSFFSIYFQIKVVKKVCNLCLIIQFIFWLEFIILKFIRVDSPKAFSVYELCSTLSCLALPGLVWILVKPIVARLNAYDAMDYQILKIKYNPRNFYSMLNAESIYVLPPLSECLYFGEGEIKNTIAIVTDPLCKPCSDAMNVLLGLLKYRNDIRIIVIFLPFTNEIKTSYVKHIYSLFNLDPSLAKQAMLDWQAMKVKNHHTWSAKYPVNFLRDITTLKDTHNSFCHQSSTHLAPTIFVNGRKLPDGYFAEDLKYFL